LIAAGCRRPALLQELGRLSVTDLMYSKDTHPLLLDFCCSQRLQGLEKGRRDSSQGLGVS